MCAKQFYNELYGAIENYLQENKDTVDIRMYRVNNIDTPNLADVTVKFVDVSNLPVMAIEFDVALEEENFLRRNYKKALLEPIWID